MGMIGIHPCFNPPSGGGNSCVVFHTWDCREVHSMVRCFYFHVSIAFVSFPTVTIFTSTSYPCIMCSRACVHRGPCTMTIFPCLYSRCIQLNCPQPVPLCRPQLTGVWIPLSVPRQVCPLVEFQNPDSCGHATMIDPS